MFTTRKKIVLVVARMTIIRKNDKRMIVEVQSNATFSKFYRYYEQDGAKASTRRLVRTSNRNDGLRYVNAHMRVPGLETLALRWMHQSFGAHVESIRIRYFQKRLYKRLLNANPSTLGMVKTKNDFHAVPVYSMRPVGPATFDIVSKVNRPALRKVR